MKKSRFKRALLILFIVFALFVTFVFCISELKKADSLKAYTADTIHHFYAEERDSLDGIYLGSSAANRYWAPAEAFDEEGICIYNLGTYVQPFFATEYLIKEALKSQTKMKVIIIEVRNLVRPPGMINDDNFITISDMMPYSSNRSEMIKEYLDYSAEIGGDIDYSKNEYHVPALREGGQWLKDFDISLMKDLYNTDGSVDKGYKIKFEVEPVDKPAEFNDKEPLEEDQKELLRDLLEYCNRLDVEVIFVSAPFSHLNGEESKIRTALDICEEEGFDTLDFNSGPLQHQLGVDWNHDFYNYKHMNWYGAEKYTDYLASYLAEEYELDDHRQEPGYESWHKAVETLKSEIQNAEKITID